MYERVLAGFLVEGDDLNVLRTDCCGDAISDFCVIDAISRVSIASPDATNTN